MAKIGIDIRCLVDGKRTGVEEYTLGLLEHVFAMDQRNEYVLFINSFHEPKSDLSQFEQYKNVKIKKFRIPNKLLNLSFWYFGWPYVDKMLGGVDVFFMPNINFIGLSKNTKLLLTVHDLSFENCPETFSLKRRIWHSFINPKKLCQRADKIIAISDSTRQDIISKFRVRPERVVRIYNGVSDAFSVIDRNDTRLLKVKDKQHLPFSFVLFLGTIEPRKNVVALVRAFDKLKDKNHPEIAKYKLVIAGAKGWKTDEIFSQMRGAKHTNDIIYTNRISDEDKPVVYNLASAFVYPSLFEGFGFPPLEAMKCGVPVIASNNSSLPEVVGDAGIMIDSEKPDEILKALEDVLLDRKLSQSLSERGPQRACMFSWRSSAREFLDAIRTLA